MINVQRFHPQRHCVSCLSVVLALLLGLGLEGLFKLDVSPLFFAAVVFSSWYGGLAPGLIATVLAILAKDYFFISPFHLLGLSSAADVLELIVFSAVALLISSLNAELKAIRQRLEANITKLQVRYSGLLETANEGIWIFDNRGQTEYVNQQLADMLGYSIEKMVDRPIFDFMESQTRIEIEQWLEQQRQKNREIKQQFDLHLRRKDKSALEAVISISPILNKLGEFSGAIAMLTDDITKHEQHIFQKQEWLDLAQNSDLMFRTLADTMPQMFWITQPDGYHEYFNRRWYDYTGKTLEQTQGEGWQDILHPDDVQRTIAVWQTSLQTGKIYDIEYRFRRAADGEYRWHLGRAFPLKNQDGQIVKWFGSCTDIHDQKLAIDERAQALERERNARIELEKANRMKDDFLAIVSHELRSPLNPILGWSKLLLNRKLDIAKTTQALEVIERNAQLQARLIEDLLDVSRILRGKLSLNISPVDLVAIIEAALDTIYLAAEAKSIQIQTHAASVGIVEADYNRLQQVFVNLLTNAIKFTPAGGRVEIRLDKVGSQAQIEVSDTGKGISPDFLPYVFDRFRQADDTTTRKSGGLGLGLAIVHHIVELHGGSVEVASQGEGLGATFTVMLPLITSSQYSQDDRLPDNSPNLQGLRIVVVDDDIDTLNLLVFILEQYGAQVEAVGSAREALEAIANTKPDFLLSDIAMPEVDGYMLIRQVRALEVSQGNMLPAIALTAVAGEVNHNNIISAGFQRYLTKPVEPVELAAAIADLSRHK